VDPRRADHNDASPIDAARPTAFFLEHTRNGARSFSLSTRCLRSPERDRNTTSIANKDRVSASVRLTDELPDELIVMDGAEYNLFVLSVSTLKGTLELHAWNSRGYLAQNLDRSLGEAISELRACLNRLPDQQIPASTAGLPFIEDDILRESIRRDIASADFATGNGKEQPSLEARS
jgi:hypothetical protein